MVTLSVNINKIALIRNSRDKNFPDILNVCDRLISLDVRSITIHPRPDERHIRYQDVYNLKSHLPKDVELNIEGYPSENFMKMTLEIKPSQCTLVPDPPDALTSSAGWDCKNNQSFLKSIIDKLKQQNIRTSIFLEPNASEIKYAFKTGTDRVELYTEAYAKAYHTEKKEIVFKSYIDAAKEAQKYNLEVNAGHDLNLDNLSYFSKIPNLSEVSIGHALVVDMLEYGIQKTIGLYQEKICHS